MKHFFLFILLTTIQIGKSVPVSAQENFITFDTANGKDFVHGVAEVIVIDKRHLLTDSLGIIKTGKMNGKCPLVAKLSLATGIENYYKNLSANSKIPSDKKLVILLYKFNASEVSTGFTDEDAEFTFAADYFISDDNNKYRLLGMIDTIIKVSSIDVTKKLLRTIDQFLCKCYEYSYTVECQNKQQYSYDEVLRYDELEKYIYPAYHADSFSNGLYRNWKKFLALQKEPGKKICKRKNKFRLEFDRGAGKKGYSFIPSKTKVIAYEGKAYIEFGNIFYQLIKKDNNFYFTGKLFESNDEMILSLGLMFDILVYSGTKVAPTGLDGTFLTGVHYEFRIEPRSGKTILLQKSRTVKG